MRRSWELGYNKKRKNKLRRLNIQITTQKKKCNDYKEQFNRNGKK